MKVDNLTIMLSVSIFILLLVSFYYHNYFKEYFESSSGTDFLGKIKVYQFTRPNDSVYLGLKKEDQQMLLVSF